jgi:hypothetical protein
MKGGRGLTMANKPLPENIQKIREATAQFLYEQRRAVFPHIDTWADLGNASKKLWLKAADKLHSKQDELGVAVLAEDQKFPRFLTETEDRTNDIEDYARLLWKLNYRKVVSIVTGTPKEG